MKTADKERRRFTRFATTVSLLALPVVVYYLTLNGTPLRQAVILGLFGVGAFRGAADLAFRRLIPPPDLFGTSDERLRAEDTLMRKRMTFWRSKYMLAFDAAVAVTVVFLVQWLLAKHGITWFGTAGALTGKLHHLVSPSTLKQLVVLPLLFAANFLIFMGPMMLMGISQIHGFEPGDSDWGVKLEDVRGQAEAKSEISKVITLWQSGDKFTKAGGKRERGILFLGPPGVGKTMLAKGIATAFNCPIVMIPGSGFAQTFIGIDVLVVRYMARKARKLAARWGGQCIVFIDEIDAVGMRRAALQGGGSLSHQIPGGMMGGMMGGNAINQLLVVMDGIDNPPFLRRTLTSKINLLLDAMYVIPQRLGRKVRLRLPKAKPTGTQIYFIGATNVPLEALDPALTRPGRMGRHIYFRTPTKRDRMDIFDLYLGKVAHDPLMDTDKAREELARVTDGYSPADIEQVCSIALTYAHHSERDFFSREDLLEAMVTVEAGTALGWGYESEEEERSTAIHEAGHALCAYLYQEEMEAVRLSIRKRGRTGGHHAAIEKVERFSKYQYELVNRLVTLLGAYAAEVEFYGHNTQGVGGDLHMASTLAGQMVGQWGMPAPSIPTADVRQLEKIGSTLVSVARQGETKLPPSKAKTEHQLLGTAYVIARATVQHNRAGIEKVVATLLREKEVYGNDLGRLLDGAGFEAPDIDWSDIHAI